MPGRATLNHAQVHRRNAGCGACGPPSDNAALSDGGPPALRQIIHCAPLRFTPRATAQSRGPSLRCAPGRSVPYLPALLCLTGLAPRPGHPTRRKCAAKSAGAAPLNSWRPTVQPGTRAAGDNLRSLGARGIAACWASRAPAPSFKRKSSANRAAFLVPAAGSRQAVRARRLRLAAHQAGLAQPARF